MLGGEALAVWGRGFGTSATQLRVTFGSYEGTVVEAKDGRLVVLMPQAASLGTLDVTVTNSNGLAVLPSGVRYEGPGAPPDTVAQSIPTTTPLWQVSQVVLSPVLSAGLRTDATFGSLAVAVGSSDSALVLLGNVGVALSPIALGVVPVSVTARLWPLSGFNAGTGTGTVQLQVLAVDALGTLAVGGLNFTLSSWVLASQGVSLPVGYPILMPKMASEAGCDVQRLQFTTGASRAVLAYRPASAWLFAALDPSSIDPSALSAGTAVPGLTSVGVSVGGTLAAWAPLDDQHLIAAVNGPEGIVEVDVTSGVPVVSTFLIGGTAAVTGLGAACGSVKTFTALATSGPSTSAPLSSQYLAVAYTPATGIPQVGIESLGGGVVSCRIPGPAVTSLAFGNLTQVFPAVPDVLLASSLSNLEQFAVTVGGAAPSPYPQAAVSIGSDPLASVPTFGGLVPTAGGDRVLVIDPSGNLDTVLPDGMSSLGAVYRLAPYGAVSMVTADVEDSTQPVAVAEHTVFTTDEGTSTVDTAGSVLVLPLGDSSPPISLGATSYARGSAWLSASGVGAELAFAADAAGAKQAARAAAFGKSACTGDVDLVESWTVGGPPDYITVGPARAGAFGPSGLTRYGPSPAPAYFAFGSTNLGGESGRGDARMPGSLLPIPGRRAQSRR